MTRGRAMLAIFLFIGIMLGFGIWYAYQRAHARPEAPVQATITVYSDLPNAITSYLADTYQDKYHVKVKVLPLTSEQMTRRMKANYLDQNGDLVLTDKDKLVLGATSGHFQGMYSEYVDLLADRYKDSEGRWVGIWLDPVVFTQNTRYYNGLGQFITTWGTLAKPGPWTIVMTDFMAAESAANILYSFVETEGLVAAMNYMKALGNHVTQHAKYLDTPLRLASLNEVNIGIGNYSDSQIFMGQGYPVKVIFPQDGTPYFLTGVAILKSSTNYEASANFANWLLSKEAANDLQKQGFYFVATNPEIKEPVDSLHHSLILFDTQGGYTDDGKKQLLDMWLKQVRFAK